MDRRNQQNIPLLTPHKPHKDDEHETAEEEQKLQAFRVTWPGFSNLGWINTKITQG